jgi:hypothetical protein
MTNYNVTIIKIILILIDMTPIVNLLYYIIIVEILLLTFCCGFYFMFSLRLCYII